MKLYTEFQMLEAIDRALFSKPNINSFDILEDIMPIELYTFNKFGEVDNSIEAQEKGIQWMRDKIQGGNNDE